MQCPRCGAGNAVNTRFCAKCGSQMPMPPQNFTPPPQSSKPWYKHWWVWPLLVIGILMMLFLSMCTCIMFMPDSLKNTPDSVYKSQNQPPTVDRTEKPTEKLTEKATEKPTEPPTTQDAAERSQKEKEKYIADCEPIDYSALARNPDKYKEQRFSFTGEVIQVVESESLFNDTTTLRVNVTKSEDFDLWTDTILCTVTIPKGSDRILENDIITAYGECDGLYTYKSIFGEKISLPKIDIKYYEINP